MEVKEVAERLGVHINTIYHYINTGHVKAQKKGRSWDIPEEEFNKLKIRQSQTPRTIIESLNVVIDNFERIRDIYINLNLMSLQNGATDRSKEQALERLGSILKTDDQINEYNNAVNLMLKKRNDMYAMLKRGDVTMDEVLDHSLNSSEPSEYRYGGEIHVKDES